MRSTDDFHRRGRGWQSWCKDCRREYDAMYHQRTRLIRKAQKRRYQAAIAEWSRELKNQPCTDCGGVFHYAAMEWDHRPGEEKVAEVSLLVLKSGSRRRILEEIAKCDLVCANCHAVRTFERIRGVAQPGRALALGARGRQFESARPDS
jgi:hypothetical protein